MSSRTTTRRRRIGAAVLTVAALAAVGITATQALFTDEETIGNNTFGVANIDLVVGPTTAAFTVPDMMPGDMVFRTVTVTNDGTAALRYNMSTSTPPTDALASDLRLAVAINASSCDAAGWGSGTELGSLTSLAGDKAVFGNPAQGVDPGDRNLASEASEVLCVRVSLPLAATPAYSATATVDFIFEAEQSKNNV